MSRNGWQRHATGAVAVDDLLDAAGQAFADLGVARATMVDVARRAGCSRATLYRYFPNREALQVAFVHRATLRIAQRLADARRVGSVSPELTMTDRILLGIEAVRADPLLAVWFEPENMAVPMALSQDSEVLRSMAAAFVAEMDAEPLAPTELERRGGWLLRSIVTVLAMPGEDAAAERAMVETFVVPVLTGESNAERTRR